MAPDRTPPDQTPTDRTPPDQTPPDQATHRMGPPTEDRHTRVDDGPTTESGPAAGDDVPPQDDPTVRFDAAGQRIPKKLTVTRVALMRGRELTSRSVGAFRRAVTADGAGKSGLTALTFALMANFAADAAMAVALANTLFFSAATGEDRTGVALYLLITIAPFAVIAPLIGPLLDRLQTGRRLALAASFAIRVVLAIVLVFEFDTWMLYPAALAMMVLSKSFTVLKSAVTPRVVPPGMDLVRVNARLTIWGLIGGSIVAGGVAAGIAWLFGSEGALWFASVIAVGGAYLSMRIPSWVEVTEGEVETTLTYLHGPSEEQAHTRRLDRLVLTNGPHTKPDEAAPADQPDAAADPSDETGRRRWWQRRNRGPTEPEPAPGAPLDESSDVEPRKRRQPLGRDVLTGLWGNGTIRILTGFLTLFTAFVAKAHTEHDPLQQAAMLGMVGAGAAIGNFTGNFLGSRVKPIKPSRTVVICAAAATVGAALAAVANSIVAVAVLALVAAGASALAKVSLDAALQEDLPVESIASGFGRSETVLQLSWVLGGAMGVLLPTEFWIGFACVAAILTIGFVQTLVTYRGSSLIPGLGGARPRHATQEMHS